MFCTNCGQNNDQNSKYCVFCGAEIMLPPDAYSGKDNRYPSDNWDISEETGATGAQSNTAPSSGAAPTPLQRIQNRPFGKIVIILVIVLLVVGAAGLVLKLAVEKGVVSGNSQATTFFINTYNTLGYKISTPGMTIKKLEEAINDLDIDAALECIDPKETKAIKAGLNILGKVYDIPISDILDLIHVIPSIVIDNIPGQPLVAFDIVDVKINGDKAVVTVTTTFQYNGKTGSETTDLNMIKSDGVWYLKTIS